MDREVALSELKTHIEHCTVCQKDSVGKAVVGEGNLYASVMFVGEAPGKQEAATGRPFVGRSGQLLRSAIEEIGLSEKDVYITSVVKYLPKKGTPTQQQVDHAQGYLQKQIALINPSVLVLLGRIACEGVLDEKVSVAKEHGTLREKEGRDCFISYHPAAALRFPQIRTIFFDDFEKLKKILSQAGI